MPDEVECEKRASVIACAGHVLVIGGPGSGKTTVALRKAVARIQAGIRPGQSVLFLSFSRAAVTRVLDAAKLEVPGETLESLSVQTFHSFFWSLLKTHGYLLGTPNRLSILLPQDEKALSGGINAEDTGWQAWCHERERLFRQEGRVAFDLFAPNAATLLAASAHLRQLVADRFPLVIVDEAQDTGDNAWKCVELLAPHLQVVCLADLEQQIFDFLPGVGPERVAAIRTALAPLEVDLGGENHRSPDSEILAFANDVLNGTPRGDRYKGVSKIPYGVNKSAPNWNHLLRRALGDLHRAIRAETGEFAKTLAILTSSKGNALRVSNALNGLGSHPGKRVRHKLLFDEAEALLTSRMAAFLLEPKSAAALEVDVATCMELLAAAKSATGGAKKPVETLLRQAASIRDGKPLKINIAEALRATIGILRTEGLSGDPAADWLKIKRILRDSGQAELQRAASHLDFLVAFRRGERISAALAAEWLRDGAYAHARAALDTALAQEQILDGTESPRGVHVMNIHKAKGKQFDGVILVREMRRTAVGVESSFVWRDDTAPYVKSRRLIRVAATRARRRLLILDPVWPACPLMKGHKL